MAPFDCASDDSQDFDERSLISLSQSLPSSTLSHILHANQANNVDDDVLSSSCFADLCRVKTEPVDAMDDDDELTCLDWLQDINLLQSINSTTQQCSEMLSNSELSVLDAQKENTLSNYDAKRNLNSKPPYSFSVLIFMAIEASPRRRLPVKEIYNWIAENFPYYRRAPVGWRNSVRHNLSLNKCFRKVEKSLGKGSSWCIDPLFRPNLLQAMKRTPYYPFQQLQMSSCGGSPANSDDSWLSRCYYGDVKGDVKLEDGVKIPSPYLFPFCRRVPEAKSTSADDIDVANTLASLKDVHNASHVSDRERKLRRIRAVDNLADVVRTPPPSTDHSYGYEESLLDEARSSMSLYEDSVGSPVDEVYEFDNCDVEFTGDTGSIVEDVEVTTEEYPSKKRISKAPHRRKSEIVQQPPLVLDDDDAEEERKRLEGVNALLNLAANSSYCKQDTFRCAPSSGVLWARAICNRKKEIRIVKKKIKLTKKCKNNITKCKVTKSRKTTKRKVGRK